jgi:hypothetical protein
MKDTLLTIAFLALVSFVIVCYLIFVEAGK